MQRNKEDQRILLSWFASLGLHLLVCISWVSPKRAPRRSRVGRPGTTQWVCFAEWPHASCTAHAACPYKVYRMIGLLYRPITPPARRSGAIDPELRDFSGHASEAIVQAGADDLARESDVLGQRREARERVVEDRVIAEIDMQILDFARPVLRELCLDAETDRPAAGACRAPRSGAREPGRWPRSRERQTANRQGPPSKPILRNSSPVRSGKRNGACRSPFGCRDVRRHTTRARFRRRKASVRPRARSAARRRCCGSGARVPAGRVVERTELTQGVCPGRRKGTSACHGILEDARRPGGVIPTRIGLEDKLACAETPGSQNGATRCTAFTSRARPYARSARPWSAPPPSGRSKRPIR